MGKRSGLDALANAGFPDGGWRSILVADLANPSKPLIQTTGPFAGFFVSKTALLDTTRKETDPARYVDATQVPYLVFPGQFHAIKGTGSMGDFAMVRNLRNSQASAALVADVGPSDAPLGEVSIRLAEKLGAQTSIQGTAAVGRRGHSCTCFFQRAERIQSGPLRRTPSKR